jgi:AraC family transcriptional regulator
VRFVGNDFRGTGPNRGGQDGTQDCQQANVYHETGEFDYIAGFEVETVADIAEGMVSMQIPEATYAAFATTLPAVGETFRSAYHKWLPQSGYQPTGGPELELYGEEFDAQDPTSTFEVYIPIG